MTRFEPIISRDLQRKLAAGTAEWIPGSGGVRGGVREVRSKKIIAQPVLRPVSDGKGDSIAAAVAVLAAAGAGVAWISERRTVKKLNRDAANLRDQLAALTEELTQAQGARKAQVKQDINDIRGRIVDLEETRAQRRQPRRAAS